MGLNLHENMRVLVIDDCIPAPELGWGYPRADLILNCLLDIGCEVSLLPLQNPKKIQPHTDLLKEKGIKIKTPDRSNLKQFFRKKKDRYDVIWISRTLNMIQTIDIIRKINPTQKVIYDTETFSPARDILRRELYGKKLSEDKKKSIIQKELDLMNKADMVVAVSERERKTIENFGIKPVEMLSFSMDAYPTSSPFKERMDILFVGAFLDSPSANEDSIIYFVNEIYPKVYKALGAKLWIVGTGSDQVRSIKKLNSDNIVVAGKIEKLWDVYDRCKVFVVPTRYASGIPLKLIGSLAHGLPCVVTPLIAEQLELNENTVLIGADPEDFAQKIIQCYTDEKTWMGLRESGLQHIKNEFQLQKFKQNLIKIMQGIRENKD
ncbi:glycosyltransferase involved in cell wall biosynthesis [Neobacillus bataviensis]|uniref:Glycosyltransferase involved in cell wall biosynthesis n=1 Tax=Neobacillus bataviensis TaxID=220685 RepID=A0A561CZ05_9BACI|nr:glycosyltransferase [Neobacillus bataviensis]TWD96466.1 glycosyltransferase involved in cell wall biosynthesis [Neobacillus bataviensis]